MSDELELFREMEEYAAAHNIPIMNKVSSQILVATVKQKQPMSVLEIGTAIGYSALLMAQYMPKEGKMVSIEQDANRIDTAYEYITRAGKSEQIQLIDGDAGEILLQLEGSFDMVFIDAAKGQYLDYLQKIMGKLTEDAVIVADNVLFRGMVLGQEPPHKRYRTIVKRLREYLDFVSHDERFSTTIHDEGDGVAISYYRGENKL